MMVREIDHAIERDAKPPTQNDEAFVEGLQEQDQVKLRSEPSEPRCAFCASADARLAKMAARRSTLNGRRGVSSRRASSNVSDVTGTYSITIAM